MDPIQIQGEKSLNNVYDWCSPGYQANPPELHSLESTYLVYSVFQLYASIVSSDGSSRWLTVHSNKACSGQN